MSRIIFETVRPWLDAKGFTPDRIAALDAAIAGKVTKAVTLDRAEFLSRYVNTKAAAITEADIQAAAQRLDVLVSHIKMVRKVESGGKSFDDKGRPVILPEPHIFYRRTNGKYGTTNYSYPKWGWKPYPTSYDGRWTQLADMAERDEAAALESASWGLFQIMGFHWQALGYASVQDFAKRMAASEADHLDSVVRFIEKNGLAPALRRCKAGNPDSCRDFAKAYNGSGYEKNSYHRKMAEALK